MYEALHHLSISVSTLAFFGSLLLILKNQGILARRILGLVLLLWGVLSLIRGLVPYSVMGVNDGFMPAPLIVSGTFWALLFLAYPMEVVRPGWLSIKNFALVASPFIVLYLIFIINRIFVGQPAAELNSYSDFQEHLGQLDVWIRVPFVVLCLGYYVGMVYVLEVNIKSYNKQIEENFSNLELLDVRWLRGISVVMLAISLFWVYWVFNGGVTGALIYKLLTLAVIFYLTYNGLSQRSGHTDRVFCINSWREDVEIDMSVEDNGDMSADQFSAQNLQMNRYAEIVNEWMESQKPFLRQDFQLMDVANVIPTNRTYLSRLFNDYIGQPFCSYVQQYRVEYVKKMLIEFPNISVSEIAIQSGFNSASTMHKVFTARVGCTATKYRQNFKNDNVD